jgi:hypothetical protein
MMTADDAFARYADMVKRHKREPGLWDDPARLAVRTEAFERFRKLFEAEQ